MTNDQSPEPADDGQKPAQEPAPPAEVSPGSPEGSPATPEGSPASPQIPIASADAPQAGTEGAPVDEGLPEWEPLTPELVEDEAIRGDFVIRWAIVGLALLFGCSEIDDTRTLVHVRTGEYLATHGILPPGNDVFSSTAADRHWVNLSWLFDLCAAGVHAIGGGIGLSIFQGLLAGVAFGILVHTYRNGIRTWWGSICAGLALLACYPQLTMQPELITLVGLAAMLWLVVHTEEQFSAKTLWTMVGWIWLWSQFDQRAFLGWWLLLAMAVGQALRGGPNAADQRRLWLRAAGLGLAVVAIHPFLWESWLSPIRLYAIDYPALRQIFPRPVRSEVAFYAITSPFFQHSINHGSIAALVLFVATVVALVLNRERLHPGHVLAVIVFNLLACVTTHEIAAASFVNCVICTINAQTWYQHRFGQVYSVDWRELLFSRGGRAVTVLCLFAVAWMVISGRIDGPGGKRAGMGFSKNLAIQMDCYQQIAAHSFDDRPFHFSARQGDLLIWVGQKSFIDTRAGLFAGRGANDLLALQDRTRKAIRAVHEVRELDAAQRDQPATETPASSNAGLWQETLAKYQVTHVMPRLSGPIPAPDYITFGDLVANSDWVLTDLSAAAAVFYRNTTEGPLGEYVRDHRLDVVKTAFRTPRPKEDLLKVESVRECARAATTYDNLFSLRAPSYPAGVQEANHYFRLSGLKGSSLAHRAACATLAIRRATAGLREDSNSAEGYRILGLSHLVLDGIESTVMNEAGIRWLNSTRYLETVTALQQAVLLRPDDGEILNELFALFRQSNRSELALEAFRNMKRMRPKELTADERKQWERLINIEFAMVEGLGRVEEEVNKQLQDGADRFQVALMARQNGAVRTAIRVLEEEAIYKEENPQAKTALGAWLLEAGRIQEGLETLDAVEQASLMGGVPGWRDTVATGLLVNGDYLHSIRLWNDQLREDTTSNTSNALLTLPFQAMNPMSDQYPYPHVSAVSDILGRLKAEAALMTLKIAMTQVEMDDNVAAPGTLLKILEANPQSSLYPLIKFYVKNLTDTDIPAPPKPEATVVEEIEVIGEESTSTPKGPAAGEKPK